MTKKFLEILDNFVLYINSLFSSDSRFSFQFIPVENFNKKENNDYFDNKNECFSKLLKNEIYVNKLQPENDKIYSIDLGKRCIAGFKNSFTITPNLNVYKCHVHYDLNNNKIGRINLNGDLIIDEAIHGKWYFLKKYAHKISEKCKNCFYLPVCHGGEKVCPARFLKAIPSIESCPMENKNYKEKVIETILYAAKKYPCTTFIL